jgi:hypothetical protein
MDEKALKALNGTLKYNESERITAMDTWSIIFALSLPLTMRWISPNGDRLKSEHLFNYHNAAVKSDTQLWDLSYQTYLADSFKEERDDPHYTDMKPGIYNRYIMLFAEWSNSFIGLVDLVQYPPKGTTILPAFFILSKPNHIGPVPQPTSTQVIPVSSPRIVVGVGCAPNGNVITHEQYWQLQHDSYSLAPEQKKTVSYTLFTGVRESSSTQETANKSLDVTASGGWGPFSASVSASISKNTDRSYQLALTTERTIFVSDTLCNPDSKRTRMLLLWQLTDVINIYEPSGKLITTVEHGNYPVVISGPHWVDNLQ